MQFLEEEFSGYSFVEENTLPSHLAHATLGMGLAKSCKKEMLQDQSHTCRRLAT